MDYTTRILSPSPDDELADLPPILIDAERPDRSLSRREYVSAVKRIAVGLARHGLTDQDAVGLLSENDIYYYVLGDGVVAGGGIFSGIPTFVKQAELATAIRAAGLKWLFVAPEFLDLALATVREAGLPPSTVLVFDPPGLEPYAGGVQASLSAIMDVGTEAEHAFRNVNEGGDPAAREAFRFFTSGTTGAVKAAVITHQVAIARADLIAAMPPPTAHFLLVIGMFHVSGAMYHTRASLGGGSGFSTYISRAREAAAVIDRIQSLGIGTTMLTPPLLEAMAAALGAGPEERRRVASLRQVFFAGALCRQQVVDNIRKMLPADAVVLTGYGATELPGISGVAITDDWVTGCVGQALPSTTIKIVDPDTLQEVPPGAPGEVCVRNAATFTRYHDSPEATATAFLPSSTEPGRWFRTGDKGAADPATGALTLLGRFKEIFKVRYEEVAPAEVEGVLLQNAAIADARVTSTPARDDSKDNECLAYVVRSAAGAALTAQEVVVFVAARLAAHKAPTGGVLFCEEIPRGAMGKAVKSELDKVVPLPGSARDLVIPAH
ncbi:AMP-dependent synthetase/ligase [Cordyceps fumosorosea ARSEF 2679]|uniref:AMP-dependent synthetase/ligase n=1 Tax=Cordyceps fumosorosea (strain ARSEF 2679) TaxID=1081104 RepID=A0A167UGU2_CORFA|nr:AMP-dependent synthetase/ligase [Cordyceps fumosorosea ARSEF 2679]OAA61565.1 AMP-dependent synthetase/ligase [Cordyceps fumosorosea ARSEF 2679]